MPYKNKEDHYKQTSKWRRENQGVYREARWRVKGVDITWERFLLMYANQKGLCAICKDAVDLSAHLDHDHETGKPRGILCGMCNHMLGHARDNTTILAYAIEYLKGGVA